MKIESCQECCNYWHNEAAIRRHKKCHHLNAVDKHSSVYVKSAMQKSPVSMKCIKKLPRQRIEGKFFGIVKIFLKGHLLTSHGFL